MKFYSEDNKQIRTESKIYKHCVDKFIQTLYSIHWWWRWLPGEPQVSSLAQTLIVVRMRPSVLAMAHQRSECRLQDSHTQRYTVQTQSHYSDFLLSILTALL